MALQEHELAITVRHLGTTCEIAVGGELDVATVPAFRERMARSLRERPEIAVIDLRACAFIDSQGIQALLAVRRQAEATGTALVVIRPGGPAGRVFTLCGLGAHLLPADVRPQARGHD